MGKKEAFIKGTVILAVANVIVKLIGALYTIPLARLIGADGIGIYSSAYQSYLWLFILSTTGFPIAISKMVSEEIALKNFKEAHKIFKVALSVLIVIGAASSLMLYFFATPLLNIIGTQRAYLSLTAISPCLIFVAVMSAYRGYFQGMQNMVPTAASQLIEAIIKATFGLLFAYLLIQKGVEYSSAGATLGVTLGSLIGMLLILFLYGIYKKRIHYNIEKYKLNKKSTSSLGIISKLIKISLPITMGSSIFAISGLIDLTMIMRRLKEIGFSEIYAIKMYGYLSGYAFKIYSLPTTIIMALAISIVPIISGYYISNNMSGIRKISYASLKLAFMFSIPAAVGIGILAKPILKLLFNDSNAKNLLMILAFSVVFVSVAQVSGSILQGISKTIIPVINIGIGSAIKIFMNYLLVGIPQINILGAPIATGICYLTVSILNIYSLFKYTKLKVNLWDILLRPCLASGIMGLIAITAYNMLYLSTKMNSVSTLGAIMIGGFSYLIIMVLLRGINKKDFDLLPFGEKISKYLFKLKIFG